jgi:hypothetical protein
MRLHGWGTREFLAGLRACEDFATLVRAALLADAVGKLALVAVGALGEASRGQEVVAAALRGALLGVAPFRIRHCSSLSIRLVRALKRAGHEAKSYIIRS